MVRKYVKKAAPKCNYTEEDVARALIDMEHGDTVRVAAARHGIPSTSLYQRYAGRSQSPRKIGCKPALLRTEEMSIAQNLASLGDFGMAFDVSEVRTFVKHLLDSQNRTIPEFKDNLPGVDWVYGFLQRHSPLLSSRTCQNISRKRATVSEADVTTYFDRLLTTLVNVPQPT